MLIHTPDLEYKKLKITHGIGLIEDLMIFHLGLLLDIIECLYLFFINHLDRLWNIEIVRKLLDQHR